MKYRRLGKSGLKLSELSFGSWVTFGHQIDNNLAEKLMTKAYDSGVNFFDNAEVYANGKSEIVMGEIFKKTGWSRDSFVVSSKVYWGGERPNQYGLSRKHIFEACHASLKRLQVDYLDLYYCHRPDEDTPIEETVWMMQNLIVQGKVLYWGTSNWNSDQLMKAYSLCNDHDWIPPTMEQPKYNLLNRDRVEHELSHFYEKFGLGITSYSPLESGLLSGKYQQGVPEDTRISLEGYEWIKQRFETAKADGILKQIDGLLQIANDLEIPLSRLCLAWCLKNPNISSMITGATNMIQLEENLHAPEAVDLINDEIAQRIEKALEIKNQDN